MPIYIARFGVAGPAKIGFSDRVTARLGNIQSRLWDEMRLLRLLDGTRADERALHKRFATLHIRGEWYSFSPLMMGDLGLPDISREPGKAISSFARRLGVYPGYAASKCRSDALRAWMTRNGVFEEDIARATGCNIRTVASWLAYGHLPPHRFRTRLVAASNGELAGVYGPDAGLRSAA